MPRLPLVKTAAALAAGGAWLLARPAAAQEGTAVPFSESISIDRPHAMIEVGVGALSLPYKDLCIPTQNRCATSDFTLLGSLRYLLRWNSRFAAGAGTSLGFRPLSDEANLSTREGIVERTHSRNYFVLAGQIRYYALTRPNYEVWLGGGAGVIVVSDRYDLVDRGTAIINPKSTTLASEGPMVGVNLGVDWTMAENWRVGGWTHQMLWFLPDGKRCAPTGDCASLTGSSYSLELGLSLTYRARL